MVLLWTRSGREVSVYLRYLYESFANPTKVMGYSADGLPHIGVVPGKPNQFILAGFTGHGMPQIFLSARGIASMAVEGKDFEETGVPRIYKTTQARLDCKTNRTLESWIEGTQGRVSSKL